MSTAKFMRIVVFLAVAVVTFASSLGSQVHSNVVQIQLTATVPESVTVACDPTSWNLTEKANTVNCTATFNTQQGRSTRAISLVSSNNSKSGSVTTPVIDRW